MDSPHKGQRRGALICAWTNGWANNRDVGNLRRHLAHHDVIVSDKRVLIYHGEGFEPPMSCQFCEVWENENIRIIIPQNNLTCTGWCIKLTPCSVCKVQCNPPQHISFTGVASEMAKQVVVYHDGVVKWKHFLRYWPFVKGIHGSPVDYPHKGQWRWALMFSLICVWTNGWANNRDASYLRRQFTYYDITVMTSHQNTLGSEQKKHVSDNILKYIFWKECF